MTKREIRERYAEQATGLELDENGDWKATIRPLTPTFHKPEKPVMFITSGEWTSKAADVAGDSTIAQARQGVSRSGGEFCFLASSELPQIP